MADSNAEFTKKILVDVEVKSENLKKDLPVLTSLIDQLTVSQAAAKKAGDSSSKTYIENAQQLRQLKAEVREVNKYIDNVSKAIYAETGSIQQNRAILSLVTNDYVKLGQVENQTAAETIKLAVDVNNLSDRLKEQEKQIGQTYRNVGNYTDSINKSNIATKQAGQGLQTFSSGLENVRKGMGFLPQSFTAMAGPAGKTFTALQSGVAGFSTVIKENNKLQEASVIATKNLAVAEEILAKATEEAAIAQKLAAEGTLTNKEATIAQTAVTEAQTAATAAKTEADVASKAATSALSIETVGLIGSIVGVIAVIGSVISWFAKLTPNAEALSRTFSGLGSAYTAFMSDLGEGVGFGQLWDDMHKAYLQAKELKGEMQDLDRQTQITSVNNANADEKIALLTLKMRNKRSSPADEHKYFNEIQDIATKSYEQRKDIAQKEYDIAVKAATIGRKFTDDEIKQLREKGVEYAAYLDKVKGLANKGGAGTDVAAFAKAQEDMAAAERYNQTKLQRAQNVLDAKDMKAEKQAAAAQAKADKLLQDQKAAYDEAENLRKSSAAKELQNLYEDYGDKAIAIDQNYNNELTKLKKFLDKKLITQKEYNSVEGQLTREKNSSVAKLISDFQDKDIQTYLKADQELRNLQIANIAETTAREIAGVNERASQEDIAIQESNKQHLKNIDALNFEIKKLKGQELDEAKERLRLENLLIQENDAKQVQQAIQTAKQIADINKRALDQQNKLKDNNDTNAAVTKFGANSSQALAARQQALLDNYNAEVSNEALTAAAKLEIERKYLADKAALDKNARDQKIEYAVAVEQQVQSGVFDILSQGLQQGSERILSELDARKSAELENNSLTNTQKKLIDKKYANLEKAEKERAFKANQKLQVANILINGAVGISKTIAEMGFLPAIPFVALTAASTAFSIAKVLSAKPAFAQGGQFESDGRGAVLPGYSKTDNTNARLRSGEAVVVSEAMRVPWARNAVSSINEMFGGRAFGTGQYKNPFVTPGFATGGVFTDGGNANRYYSAPVYDSAGLANSLAYQLINNFPPIVADIKDIISEQAIKIQTDNRVNL